MATAAVAVALVSLVTPSAVATAGPAVVPADSVNLVVAPGITLHLPADGRINGYGFAGSITGYRFAHQVGFGDGVDQAGPGQRLLVFGLQGAPLVAGSDQSGNPTPTVHPLLVVDGAQEALPTPPAADSGPTYFMASVPLTASDVGIQIANNGFSQTFSFTHDAREGVQPAVLYASRNSWYVSDPIAQTITVATPDPTENIPGAALDVTASSAALTWFGPDAASDNPSDPQTAWLILDSSSRPHPISALPTGFELNYLSTLPGNAVTLSVPGNPTPIPAKIAGQGGPSDESQNHTGIFGGVYYWQIPVSLTKATVTITPGTLTAESNYLGTPQTIAVTDTASFPLSFPAVYQPPPPPASPPADAPNSPQAAASATPKAQSSSSSVLLAIVVLLAIIIVAALGLLTRRRRRSGRAATDVAGPLGTVFASTAPSVSPGSMPFPPEYAPNSAPTPPPTEIETTTGWATAHPFVPAPATAAPPPTAGPSPSTGAPPPPAGSGGTLPRWVLVPPSAPPPVTAGEVRVDVFGPPRAVGWPAGSVPPGQTVLEILVFLVLHPGERFSTEALCARLGIGRERDLDPGTVRRYLNELRRALGDERVPESKAGGGYHVLSVTSDAASFYASIENARLATTPVDRVRALAAGLAWVGGAPFAEAPRGAYGWAETDSDQAAGLTNSVLRAASDLARLAIEADDSDLADWAVERGLLVSPIEEHLYQLRLTAAAAVQPSRLGPVWAQIKGRLAQYREAPSPALEEHYRRLRDAG